MKKLFTLEENYGTLAGDVGKHPTNFYYLHAHSSKLPQFPYGVLSSNDPNTATLIFSNVGISSSSEH